jgi:hypothetical protein
MPFNTCFTAYTHAQQLLDLKAILLSWSICPSFCTWKSNLLALEKSTYYVWNISHIIFILFEYLQGWWLHPDYALCFLNSRVRIHCYLSTVTASLPSVETRDILTRLLCIAQAAVRPGSQNARFTYHSNRHHTIL